MRKINVNGTVWDLDFEANYYDDTDMSILIIATGNKPNKCWANWVDLDRFRMERVASCNIPECMQEDAYALTDYMDEVLAGMAEKLGYTVGSNAYHAYDGILEELEDEDMTKEMDMIVDWIRKEE